MERHNLLPDNSTFHSSPRYCAARVTDACTERGGLLEGGRSERARYCRDCAKAVRLKQSRLRKRQMRKADWRDYRRYSFDQQGWRKFHREYMREWRKRRKGARKEGGPQ